MKKFWLILFLLAMLFNFEGYSGYAENEVDPSHMMPVKPYGFDGTYYPKIKTDSDGNLQVDILTSISNSAIEKIASQNLASGALVYTSNFAHKVKIAGVYIHASGAITETITIKLNSGQGANYDTIVASQSLSAETNYTFSPSNLLLTATDELDITCTNANLTGTVYVLVKAEELN